MNDLLQIVASAPLSDLPRLLGQLKEAEATALARLYASASQSVSAAPERLLDVREASERLKCSPDWLYRHAHHLPFTRRPSYGLRFSESALNAYIRTVCK